jgi:hypothetical protein
MCDIRIGWAMDFSCASALIVFVGENMNELEELEELVCPQCRMIASREHVKATM